MSLVPFMMELANEPLYNRWYGGHRMYPHEMDIYSTPHSLLYPSIAVPRMLANLGQAMSHEVAQAHIDKDGFRVRLDVKNFTPNEITVKTIDNTIVVEAKHEEREDEHGYISREFTRRYNLPKGFDVKDVVTQLSSDGILIIKAPPQGKALENANVRVLEIQPTGPVRMAMGQKDTQDAKIEANAGEKVDETEKIKNGTK